MPAAAIWKPSVIVTADGQINQITNSSIDPGISLNLLRGEGKIAPQFGAVGQRKPSASFSTTALKRVLDWIGSKGKYYTGGATMYLAKKALGGGFAGATSHVSLTAAKCLILPRTLRATQGEIATLDCEVYIISSDGLAAALTYAASVSLPTIALTDQAWTLGPASINGSVLTGLSSMEITFGLTAKTIFADGQELPAFCCIESQVSQIRVTTYDVTALNSFLAGSAVNSASRVFLRAKANEGGNVIDATASHIKFEITTTGIIHAGPASGSDEGDESLEVIWNALDDGTNDVLVMNTACAIV